MNKAQPKKRFSQNFLNDKNILEKIAKTIDLKNKKVIEIGPGQGSLTSFLIKDATHVVAFEIDQNLFQYLNEKFNNTKNFELNNLDFLKSNLKQYKNYYIVANIPYHISTQILFKIFENFNNFEQVVLLVQKEFANRLVAQVNTKDYSKLSVTTQLYYHVEQCFDVLPSSFFPKPQVISTVIKLTRKKNIYKVDYERFSLFIKNCFAMKRKKLVNNIKKMKLDLEKFIQICNELKINLDARPENISFEQYLKIYQKLFNV